jgi:hypothetical protein
MAKKAEAESEITKKVIPEKIAEAFGVDPAEVVSINDAGTVAVVITQTDAFKVAIDGDTVKRFPDAYTEAASKMKSEEVA